MKNIAISISALALASVSSQAAAQSPPATVGAHDPATIVSAMKMGGYKAELETDRVGDPKIATEFAGMLSNIFFYGCKEGSDCSSLMLVTGFDRETPWDAASAIKISQDRRFASIWLDDEGDPWISWDIVTGPDGIPVGTFSTAVRLYADTVEAVAEAAFAEERTADRASTSD